MLTQAATKALFTTFEVNLPLALCFTQMAFAAVVCTALSRDGIDLGKLASLIPLGLINCANIVCGLLGTGVTSAIKLVAAFQTRSLCRLLTSDAMHVANVLPCDVNAHSHIHKASAD